MGKISLITMGVLVSLMFLMTSCVYEITGNYDIKWDEESTANITIRGDSNVMAMMAQELRKEKDFEKVLLDGDTVTVISELQDSAYKIERTGWFIRRTFNTNVHPDFSVFEEWNSEVGDFPEIKLTSVVTVPGKIVEVSDNCEVVDNKAVCDMSENNVMKIKSKCWFC